MRHILLLTLCLFLTIVPAWAQGEAAAPAKKKRFGDSRDRVALELKASSAAARPGERLVLAVVMDHQAGWHSHTNDPQVPPALGKADDYIKTQLKIDPRPGVTGAAGDGPIRLRENALRWPAPHETRVNFGGEAVPYGVFEGRSVILVPVTVDPAAAAGEFEAALLLTFQSCDANSCIAPAFNVKLATKITVAPDAANTTEQTLKNDADFAGLDAGALAAIPLGRAQATPAAAPATTQSGPAPPVARDRVAFSFFGSGFDIDPTGLLGRAAILGLAILGGALLNFTPCVLPVIPIKMMSLSKAAGDRLRCLWLGSVMSAGVVLFWLGLGLAISLTTALITSRGETGGITSANQLFQNPAFTIVVGGVIAVMAVGMCGLFSIQLPQFVYNYSPRADSVTGSLGMGVMTAILSTPCTAPFMGSAAAWATGAGVALTLTVFTAIGVGMALPYFLLSAYPQVASRMPRTGPASELIKQVMGLLMLAAGAYFIGTGVSGALVTPPAPPSKLYWWAVAALVVAAGLWLGWRTFRITRSAAARALWGVVALGMVVGAVGVARTATDPGPTAWVYYTPDRFKGELAQGRVVVMDFTAEWCLNCKVLERTVLDTPDVEAALRSPGVTPMKVDLTGNNEPGNAMLQEVGSVTIPLLVVFDPSGNVVFKSDAYTAREVIDAIGRAGSAASAPAPGP